MNTLWGFVTAWFNVPFTALFVLSLLMAVAQVFGLLGEHDSDADADADADADVDVHVDVDSDIDLDTSGTLDTDHDLDHDGDADSDSDSDAELSPLSLFAFIGVGKAPLAIVLMLLFGATAVIGWLLNGLAATMGLANSILAFIAVLLLALLGGALVSSRLARIIGRALPPISSTASLAQDLVGKRGTVLSPYVDGRYGLIRVRDSGGTSINVFGVIAGSDSPIARNSTVVLASYNPAKKQYLVTKF